MSDDLFSTIQNTHHRYRTSGIALMTTVITLATGGLYQFRDIAASPLFLIPIAIALLQELFHFRGSLWEARAISRWAEHENANSQKQIAIVERILGETEKANQLHGIADGLCIAAVIALLLVGTVFHFLPSDLAKRRTVIKTTVQKAPTPSGVRGWGYRP